MFSRTATRCLSLAFCAVLLCPSLSAQDDCSFPSTVRSLLPNPSLEEFHSGQDGCASQQPNGLPDGSNQANCLVGWQRVSSGTTDAWNAFTLPGAAPSFPAELPQPMPSGTSAAGFWIGIKDTDGKQFHNGDRTWATHYREYLGACFGEGEGLQRGLDYRLTFYLGFMKEQNYAYLGHDVNMASPSGVELAVYGVRECSQLNYGRFYDCPETAGAPGYELIATVTVDGEPGTWTPATVDFISPNDYAAFVIGGSCAEDIKREDSEYYRNYYFIDDIIVNRTSFFEEPVAGPVSVSGQSVCADEIILSGTPAPDATYQWFQDGVALEGATDPTLSLTPSPSLDGGYTLRIETPAGCATTEPVNIQRPVIHDQFPDSVALCREGGQVTVFPSERTTGSYTWSDGSTNGYLTVTEPGTYSVTISSSCQDRVETFTAVETADISYRYRMSPEQPCAGDTVEVTLETGWYAPMVIFTLSDERRFYTIPNQPIQVVAGETDWIEGFIVTSCNMYSDTVTVSALEPYVAEAHVRDLNCVGPDGSISLDIGGEQPDRYAWTGPDGSPLPATGPEITADRSGDYTVSLTGPGRCPTPLTVSVADREFTADILTTDASCGGDGTASALLSGGTPPYSLEWLATADQPLLAGQTTVLTDLDRGSYLARVRDGGGCETMTEFTIDGPDPLQMRAEVDVTGCSPETIATLDITASGGTAPYTYAVSGLPLQTSATITDLDAGDYSVQVIDAHNCTTMPWNTTVTLPDPVAVALRGADRVNLGATAALTLDITGTDPDEALIFWDTDTEIEFPDGPLEGVIAPEAAATIAVEVVTPDDCIYTDSLHVSVFDGAQTYVPTAFSPNGDGNNDRFEIYPNLGVTGVEHFRVFDRWGGLVFEQSGEEVAWDGTANGSPLNTGTYFYEGAIRLRRGAIVPLKGTILLTR
ncbi:gliding motility-associated C-terminal domain-containing protein [Lewinella sp. IMCC34183]|uniref:T9SS type B sorting domain-containing protein n=1 Tax=Lewinella sp. IMCC34183 TaxID=2248762 RepID=UPI0013002864|nr:gliding motility-associated C-terminal domain-containing protein [Lewinella sp. IMCC34183]